MANIKSAAKRARQSERRRQKNVAQRSRMRTALKKTDKAITSGDAAAAVTAQRGTASALDKAVTKGLIHRNKAARHKSRQNKAVRALRQKG